MKVTTINPIIINGKHESEPSKYVSAEGDYSEAMGRRRPIEEQYENSNGMGEYETTLQEVASNKFNDFYDADGNGMGEFETTLKAVEMGGQDNPYEAADGDDDFYNADSDDYYGFDASGKPTKPDEVKMFQKWLVAKGVDISFKNKKGQVVSGAAAIDGDMRRGSKTAKAWDTYGNEWVGVMKNLGFAIGNIGSTVAGAPTVAEQIEQAKQGKVWDKAKGWIQSDSAKGLLAKLQESGGVRGLFGSIFGSKGGGSGVPSADASAIDNSGGGGSGDGGGTPPPPPPGMSIGMKIGIAVGAVVVLGIIIYAVTRPKTSVATPLVPTK